MRKKMTFVTGNEVDENAMDVRVEDFCGRLNLEILNRGTCETIHFGTLNISRPGLQLAGYYDRFVCDRVQVLGEQETAYLASMTPEDRFAACDKFLGYKIPCLVLSSALEPCSELLECARKHDRVLLRSTRRSTMLINELSIYLNQLIAPTETVHGVLLDLYGVGVLLIGNSGIGKSETALELVQRGHRLVADDAVCIKRVSDRLRGASPAVIRHLMELRGIGIIDIRQMYGAGAVKLTKEIDLVIKMEAWDQGKEYDRLGNFNEVHTILGVELPMHTVPVRPGRNLAVIMEAAARNHRLKSMGVDTLADLDKRMKDPEILDDDEIFLEY